MTDGLEVWTTACCCYLSVLCFMPLACCFEACVLGQVGCGLKGKVAGGFAQDIPRVQTSLSRVFGLPIAVGPLCMI